MQKSDILQSGAAALALALLAGCQSSGPGKVSKADKLVMEQQATQARQLFWTGDYAAAVSNLLPLTEARSVDQPLYQCELASAYLMAGQKEEAHRTLLSVHESIEGFFDQAAEKKAASLWGRESDKVFKGEPYERATLYALLAMSMLERGDVDNALAALKTGMLADSDSENLTYKADYGLLQLLSAKCYALRGEDDLRAQMLEAAFDSFVSVESVSRQYAWALGAEHQRRQTGQTTALPPSRTFAMLCSLAGEEKIAAWLQSAGYSADAAAPIAQWAHASTKGIDPLDFNALIVIWNGTGPGMTRSGQYGEIRMIRPGSTVADVYCSLLIDGIDYDPYGGFGDVTYQAITRGGRKMDNVLSDQAAFKGAVDTGGNVALVMATQDYGDPMVNLAAAGIGLAFKGIAAATKTEADIRYWNALPNSLDILPAKLSPGTHTITARRWMGLLPMADSVHSLTVTDGAPLTVLHAMPVALQPDAIETYVVNRLEDITVFYKCLAAPASVDTNGDHELTRAEINTAFAGLEGDLDVDGTLSPVELNILRSKHNSEFQLNMVVK